MSAERPQPPMERMVGFWVDNKLLAGLLILFLVGCGLYVAPFEGTLFEGTLLDWTGFELARNPVPTDAIPDIGENQQIVFTEWAGRSPQDVEDQITYPLTVALLGVPSVKTIRSFSYFGFSSVYVVFDESVEYYWSRSRLLEKLSSLPTNTLPQGVRPTLGPDATPLGQVFWYTLEGRDPQGRATGGWGLEELRSLQDWYVRYALLSVEGVAEVASIGGFVKEYQVDVDPDAMRAFQVGLPEVILAVQSSNVDVGARTIEVNRVEHVIRGLGFIQDIGDIESAVIKARDGVPITVGNVASVAVGPALRRGALDREGVEAVGGVVVVRFGENPLEVIQRLQAKLTELAAGLPQKTLADGTTSKVTVVDFYNRADLIRETLGTLSSALYEEILVTIVVVVVLLLQLRSTVLISMMLPLAVLVTFVAMKVFGVDANIVALSGIAIAIGTIVDMGIVVTENIVNHLRDAPPGTSPRTSVVRAAGEVGGAVLTAVLTTVVGFLPVFAMEASEGKLFRPLAFTKTFALLASIVIALVILPPLAHLLFGRRRPWGWGRKLGLALLALVLLAQGYGWLGTGCGLVAADKFFGARLPARLRAGLGLLVNVVVAVAVVVLLAGHWQPLGPARTVANVAWVGVLIGGLLLAVYLFQRGYPHILRFCLDHKPAVLLPPVVLIVGGVAVWLGFATVFAFVPASYAALGGDPVTVRTSAPWRRLTHALPGLGREFMPPLDEGSYLFMPSTMPHASIGEAMDVLRKQDMAIAAIPEVATVLGKLGRVDSALDPAPISMFETIVQLRSEYATDPSGRLLRFRVDPATGAIARDQRGEPIPDPEGEPLRQWRPEFRKADDIWDEITRVTRIPGTTLAPRLQPIAARLVMLQSGLRAPIGIKVFGPDQATIEAVGLDLERLLKQIPGVKAEAVVADRMVAKPYVEIEIDRAASARHGLQIRDVQNHIEVAIGGRMVTTTVEGRERYPVRLRYLREYRDQIEELGRIVVQAPDGTQIPLGQLATIRTTTGPQVIKSEDTRLVGYVLLDRDPEVAEVELVERCARFLEEARARGELHLPAGVTYRFAGTYESQVRSQRRLAVVLPLALFVIFVILYLHFRSVIVTLLVFSGVLVAGAGGFWLLWLYGQDWFLAGSLFGIDLRYLFQIEPRNLSVAVWVGFLALFGIATDDGVIMATYLEQRFRRDRPSGVAAIREATVAAGQRRIRPCMMTTATTVLALLPVLTSTGRGADVMVPMAIPSFGGMLLVSLSVLVVPTVYCALAERGWVGADPSDPE